MHKNCVWLLNKLCRFYFIPPADSSFPVSSPGFRSLFLSYFPLFFIIFQFSSFPLQLYFLYCFLNLLFTQPQHPPLFLPFLIPFHPFLSLRLHLLPIPLSPGLTRRLCLLGECYYSITLHLDNHRLATPNWSGAREGGGRGIERETERRSVRTGGWGWGKRRRRY